MSPLLRDAALALLVAWSGGCAWSLRDPRARTDAGGDLSATDAAPLDVADGALDGGSDGPSNTSDLIAEEPPPPDGSVTADIATMDGADDLGAFDGAAMHDVANITDVVATMDADRPDVAVDTGDVPEDVVCPGSLARCGASCVDLRVSHTNCGACGGACACGSQCVAGRCAVLAPTLWYPLDGSGVDATGRGNHGFVRGTTPAADRLGRALGALAFQRDEFVRSPAAMPRGSEPRTLSAWFRTSSHQSAPGTVAAWGGPGDNESYGLIVRGGRAEASLGNFELTASGASVTDGRWHHVALTYDGAMLALFLDGTRVAQAPRTLATVTSELHVGQRASVGRPVGDWFEGAIDDVRLYDRALSEEAIGDLYAGCGPDSIAPIVFTTTRDGNREIYLMNADGGGARRLTADPADDASPRWSRDGRRIAFATTRFGGITVATVDAAGRDLRRVAPCAGVECQGFSWSPDDQWIYYHQRASDRRILRARSDGSGAPELVYESSAGRPEWADVSPDGRAIAFAFGPGDNASIGVLPLPVGMASPARWPLEPVETDDVHPRWSPEGERIVWSRGQDDRNICLAPRGAAIVCSIRTTAHETYPVWSPDARRVLFLRSAGDYELFVADADGRSERQLTDNAADEGVADWRSRPYAWVPPIAFVSNRDGNDEIYVMNPDGSDQRRLTNNPGRDILPLWSRAGTRIAFDSARPEGTGVFVMSADGSGVRLVVRDASVRAWSHDDEWLYFKRSAAGCLETLHRVRLRDGVIEDVSTDQGAIYGVDVAVDGRDVVFARQPGCSSAALEIYRGALPDLRMPFTRVFADPDGSYDDLPRWSPDARRIVWMHVARSGGTEGASNEIYVMNTDGTGVQRLTDNTAEEWCPAWSPTGNEIVFDSNRDGDREIFVMNADGTNVRQLTTNGAVDREPDWRRAAL